jgi:diaminopimelate epimerase
VQSPIPFRKGHGTQNDFVLLPDPGNALELTETRVRALCDRHMGLGADGVLRVVPSDVDADTWFMDYRNADGSIAEMCGNGVRVFARYLVDAGLVKRGGFVIGTRAGDRQVEVHDDDTVTVHMGPATVFGGSSATVQNILFPGVAVDVGNPHLACRLPEGSTVEMLDLTVQPGYDAGLFPHGVNVEFVQEIGPDAIRMRVHERGVGETRSCGTGTVAAVKAWLHNKNLDTGAATVDVPGGQVSVVVTGDGSTLTGPAEFVAEGTLSPQWWTAHQ